MKLVEIHQQREQVKEERESSTEAQKPPAYSKFQDEESASPNEYVKKESFKQKIKRKGKGLMG